MRPSRVLVVAVPLGVLVASGGPVAAQEAARPAFVIKADRGFIDDPFAVDPEADRLAILRTDSASFARADIVDLAAGKTVQAIAVGDPQQLFDRLLLAGPGGGLVVVTRHPTSGQRSAQFFGRDGKPRGMVGPATDFGLMSRAGQRYLVAWRMVRAPSGETTYTIAQHQLDGLARVGRPRAWVVARDGTFRNPPFKVVGWQDGYARIIGQKPGGYDKKKDSRQPDRAAVFDLLQSGFVSESEIGDVLGWVYATRLLATRPNRSLMAVVTDEQDAVQLVDASGRKARLTVAAPFDHYEARSLQEQEGPPPGVLHFSLAIDPLNPEALARKKADRAFLDLYRARPPAENVRILRAPLDDRPVSWAVGPRHAVILRKHKSFSRGGTDLEVYALAAR